MLTRLLELFATHQNGLSLAEISRALDAQPSAVLAMLQMLVHKGRLLEIAAECGSCADCGEQTQCNLLATRGARFVLAPQAEKRRE